MAYHFSGHETFPLRQLWPRKTYFECLQALRDGRKPDFKSEEAMVRLGVGRNMLQAMEFWGRSIGIIDAENKPSHFGEKLFEGLHGERGLDPYCEKAASLWLFHWHLTNNPYAQTTLWYLFNRMNRMDFTKEEFLEDYRNFLEKEVALEHLKQIPSAKTLDGDIVTILRSYAPRSRGVGVIRKTEAELNNTEDMCDNVFRELSLISYDAGKYIFNRNAHASLNPYVFALTLLEYWQTCTSTATTLDFNQLAYADCSPGKVFKLDELTLGTYLEQLADCSDGKLLWSDQNGLRHVVCTLYKTEEIQSLRNSLMNKAFGRKL